VCTWTPPTSGTLEIDAIVNGVPDTVRKNIGVAPNARLCSSKPLNDFWYITTEFSQVDASHKKGPHGGRDYAGPGVRGVPVFAAEAGTVAFADTARDAGNMVMVTSGTLTSYYMHMDPLAPGLHEDQSVAAGQLLGYVGSTGHAVCNTTNNPDCDPAHLHFEQHISVGPPKNFSKTKPQVPPKASKVETCFF
jgi:murein DD-endopeptidase MepM/ murein hydrolase activator NlpD